MNARIMTAVLASVAAMLMMPGAAEAAPYWPWCSQYDHPSLAHACAFISREQCMETVRGIGGYCYVNPYTPPARSPSARRRSRG